MFCFLKPKEGERNPYNMKGRIMVEARYAILAGIYPDFYGWRYYYFVFFLLVIHPVLYSYFCFAYFVSFYYAMSYHDIELMGQVLCLGTITFIYCLVSIYFIAKKSDMDALMDLMGRGFSNYSRPDTEEESAIKHNAVRSTHRYAFFSTVMLISISLVHMGLLPAIRGFKGQYSSISNVTAPINKNTPLPIWTPYVGDGGTAFVVSYFTQLIPGCMEYSIINACCIVYIGMCQQLSGNLKILCNSLRDLPARALHFYQSQGGTNTNIDQLYKNDRFLECMNKCLSENIQHHHNLIEFHQMFLEVVGFSVLAIFTGIGLIISTAAYTMLLIFEKGGDIEEFITNCIVWSFYLFVYTFLLTMYCHYGQKVKTGAEDVLRAWYDTPWIDADAPFRRSLIIAMSYSQLEMDVTALGLVSATYETLLDIIKTSFSYLNMLMAARG